MSADDLKSALKSGTSIDDLAIAQRMVQGAQGV
jgi:hypothetical protein